MIGNKKTSLIENKKSSVLGPLLVIGGLTAVASCGVLYTAVKTHEAEKNIDKKMAAMEGFTADISVSLKMILKSLDNQTSLLEKGGSGSNGSDDKDLQNSVVAALEQIETDKAAQQRAALYKNWYAAGESKNGRYLYGNPSARFTLVNYSDLECPFCKRFHETPKYLVDTAKNGMVNWEWRHFPLSFHEPMASKSAVMGECVAQQKGSKGFWAFTEYWFTHTAGNGKGFAGSESIPEMFGLDKTKYDTCLKDPSIIKRIKEDMQAGDALGVTGTPATIIIDNETGKMEKIVGAQPFTNFVQIIEKMANPEKEKLTSIETPQSDKK